MSALPLVPPSAPSPPPTAAVPRAWRWLAGTLGLALWLGWSLGVVQLPSQGIHLSPNQLSWLLALPALTMACCRVLAAVLPQVVAGSAWTWWATAALLPLAVGAGQVLQMQDVPFEALVLLALGCGTGATLFAEALAPQDAGVQRQAAMLGRRGTGRLCLLAAGGFGGALGLLAALPMLASLWCPPALPLTGAAPAVMVLAHAMGSRAAARGRARRVTAGAFAGQLGVSAALLALLWLLPLSSLPPALARATAGAASPLAPATFVITATGWLAAAGAASGATLRLTADVLAPHGGDAAAALGVVTALGAFGGFALPKVFGTSLAASGSAGPALAALALAYLGCALLAARGFDPGCRPGAPTNDCLHDRHAP